MFFWNSLAFSMIQRMLAIWSLIPLPFLKPARTSGSHGSRITEMVELVYHNTLWNEYETYQNSLFYTVVVGYMHACLVTQSCPTLCDPFDCNPACSSLHGIFQARILEWIAIPSSRESSWLRDQTHINLCLLHCRWILHPLCHQGSPDVG